MNFFEQIRTNIQNNGKLDSEGQSIITAIYARVVNDHFVGIEGLFTSEEAQTLLKLARGQSQDTLAEYLNQEIETADWPVQPGFTPNI